MKVVVFGFFAVDAFDVIVVDGDDDDNDDDTSDVVVAGVGLILLIGSGCFALRLDEIVNAFLSF